MDRAIFLATYARPGPVWIDIPIDVQSALIDPLELEGLNGAQLLNPEDDADLSPNTRAELLGLNECNLSVEVDEVINRLLLAKRPVIFVGSGIRLSGMHEVFLRLVEILKIPVVTGWNAHDTLTNDHPSYAGRPGTVGDRAGNFTVQNADFLLVLGSRLNIRQVSYNWDSFASKAWIAMIDADRSELEKPTLHIDLKIHATLQKAIPCLIESLKEWKVPKTHGDYLAWCRERVGLYPVVLPEYRANTKSINPYAFIEQLFLGLLDNDIVVTGNGSACVIGFQAAELKAGQRLFTNSGSASMGYDLPAAIGAYFALGAKRIVCLAGDGSLMMNLQELQTLIGYGLPVKVIVLNNHGYHSIRQTQEAYFSDNLFGIGPEDGVSLPDFVALARAFKIESTKVETLDEWRGPDVLSLLESDAPALIEVVVDRAQTFSPKLASRKLPDGTMVSPSLEDMAPFLSRKELKKNILKS